MRATWSEAAHALALALLAGAAFGDPLPQVRAERPRDGWYRVTVVDGDTIKIPGRDVDGGPWSLRVRIVAPPGAPPFDAPECGRGMRRGKRVAHESGCEAATEALRRLVEDRTVYLRFVECLSHNYGRPCALVYPDATATDTGPDVTARLGASLR